MLVSGNAAGFPRTYPLPPLPLPDYPGPDLSLQEDHRPPLLLLEAPDVESSTASLQSHDHPSHLAKLPAQNPRPDEGLQSVVTSLDDEVGLLGPVAPPTLLDHNGRSPGLQELTPVVPA